MKDQNRNATDRWMYIRHHQYLTDSLYQVLGRAKLHGKLSRNIYSFLLKKVIASLR